MQSIDFWKHRYLNNEEFYSGKGSRGSLLENKIFFLNEFITKNNINSILDFGYGDSEVSKQLNIENYTGIDILEDLTINQDKYLAKNVSLITSKFNEINFNNKFDLTMALDILYHLYEDETEYLFDTIKNLYDYSDQFIIIYDLIDGLWKEILENKYNVSLFYEQAEPFIGTTAKFFVYKKK